MTARLAVTGAGLVTAVGTGAAGSCAALRAGLSAPAEVVAGGPGIGDEDAPAIAGHPTRLADGFFQTGAWVRLASIATADLLARSEPPLDAAWSRGAMGVLGPALLEERLSWSADDVPGALELHVGRPLALLHAIPVSDAAMRGFTGHAALAACLAAVAREAPGSLERLLVAGADTAVDPQSLAWLAAAGRLKDPDHPTGLMPGEAGAALLLETEQAARLRKAEVLGHVEAVAVGGPIPPAAPPPADGAEGEDDDAPAWLPPPAPRLGRAIADAIRKVLPRSGGARWRGDLYLDLNGEYWRSEAWGHACVHLAREVDLDACRVLVPAACLGETGAASAPIAVAWALWSFDRDRTEQAIVVSVADDGATGAIRLSAPRLARGPG